MKRLSGRVKMAGLLVLVLVGAVVALACGQEIAEPTPAATSEASAPAATPETGPPTETPLPPTVPPEPDATATPAPTSTMPAPTRPAASDRRPSGSQGSLVLLGSHSLAAPSGSGGLGGFSLSRGPQTFAAQGSLTVSAIGSVTVAADEAYVVVIPEMGFVPSGPERLSDKDREDIRANLVSIGLAEEAVDFESVGRYEPTTISVEVDVDDFAALGESIVDQVEEVVRRSESFGVRFSLTDENCDQAIAQARREAVPAAEEAADDFADALGVGRGAVNGALEYPLQSDPYRILGGAPNRCGGDTSYRFAVLRPFDAEPEVEVSVGLQVSYDLN